MNRQKAIFITGPTGAGKTTLARELCAQEGFERWPSWTTRDPRPGEVAGADYVFVSLEDFDAGLQSGLLMEHVLGPGGAKYGLPFPPRRGASTLVAIVSRDVANALPARLPDMDVEVRRLGAEVEELAARMLARGDSADEIAARLKWSQGE